MEVVIAPLGSEHDRTSFTCGNPALDDWFKHRSNQDQKRNVARVFVAVDEELGVVGFYSLSSFTLTIEDLPQQIGRKLPRYDSIPAALIGRLARDVRSRGKGLGELMLADAIKRALSVGASIALYAIVVDAKDEPAAEFYRSFGFQSLPSRPNRLFLPTSTALAALAKA